MNKSVTVCYNCAQRMLIFWKEPTFSTVIDMSTQITMDTNEQYLHQLSLQRLDRNLFPILKIIFRLESFLIAVTRLPGSYWTQNSYSKKTL